MSRCFPYTPRVCVRKGLDGEATLIESIKLQNATEKGKTSRRREDKKDKIGKTKEERSKLCDGHGDDKVKRPRDLKKAKEERKAGSKRKHSETGNEQVEKSDLTVECGRPFFSQNTGYLSDTPKSNDKRRSDNDMPSHCDDPRKRCVIRIRLNSGNRGEQKRETAHLQLDNSYAERPIETRPTETIQRPKAVETRLVESVSAVRSNDKPEFNFPSLAQPPDNKVSISSKDRRNSSSIGLHGLEIMYRNLTDNWTPLPLHFGDQEVVEDVEDSDWLFGTAQSDKRCKNPTVKRQKSTIDIQSCQSSCSWPRAQYLEGDLYALPYTVPF